MGKHAYDSAATYLRKILAVKILINIWILRGLRSVYLNLEKKFYIFLEGIIILRENLPVERKKFESY